MGSCRKSQRLMRWAAALLLVACLATSARGADDEAVDVAASSSNAQAVQGDVTAEVVVSADGSVSSSESSAPGSGQARGETAGTASSGAAPHIQTDNELTAPGSGDAGTARHSKDGVHNHDGHPSHHHATQFLCRHCGAQLFSLEHYLSEAPVPADSKATAQVEDTLGPNGQLWQFENPAGVQHTVALFTTAANVYELSHVALLS